MGPRNGIYEPFRREDTECVEPPEPDEEREEGAGVVEGETVLVPEGEYEIRYVDYETAHYFGKACVIVRFAIIEPEEYAGLPIDRFYNVKRLDGPPRRFGEYTAKNRGNLIREFRRIAGHAGRLDRISFKRFKNLRIIAEIQTVRRDYQRQTLDEDDHYSRISKLVKVLPGEDW